MAKSLYGFAQGASSGSGKGVTAVIRAYNLAYEQAQQLAPEARLGVLQEARVKILEPNADNVQVAIKLADAQNKEAAIQDAIDESRENAFVIEDDLNSALKEVAKRSYSDPRKLVEDYAYFYSQALDRLAGVIEERRLEGKPTQDQEGLLDRMSRKEDTLVNLYREIHFNPNGIINPNVYGWDVRTDSNGDIISIDVDTVDQLEKRDLKMTNSRFEKMRVWTNAKPSNKDLNKMVATLGGNEYVLEKNEETGKEILKLQGNKFFGKGSVKDDQNVNLGSVRFSDSLDYVETGMVFKRGAFDKSGKFTGKFYIKNSDGWYEVTNQDVLQKFLGKQLDANSIPSLSRTELESFGSFYDANTNKLRVIDDKAVSSAIQSGALSPEGISGGLPTLDQNVKGTFSTINTPAFTPDTGVSTPASLLPEAKQIPRKEPGIQTEKETGKKTTLDMMGDNLRKWGSYFFGSKNKV